MTKLQAKRQLERQFANAGIHRYFFDERGLRKYAPSAVKQQILTSFGGNIPQNMVTGLLPAVKVFYHNSPAYLRLNQHNGQRYHGEWQLQLENGDTLAGKVKNNVLNFPRDLPLGYHQLSLKCGQIQADSSIIVAPRQCYQLPQIQNKQKLWGSCVQLYTLKSETNWGIGDFGDLQQFLAKFQQNGGDFVGLNPIHSLFPANPEGASPYSPSSRNWLNIIYIDVASLPEFRQSAAAQHWFQSAEVQQQLADLRQRDWIDYSAVMALKLQGLQLAFAEFEQQAASERQQQFQQFVQQGGESLQVQATFDALHADLSRRAENQWGWDCWAAEYQDYHSAAVSEFQHSHAEQVRFYAWLQWCAAEQIEACYQFCRQQQMPIGLYRDLAVGVTPNGAETWWNKSLFCLAASVGAPPDILGPQGQNWGLAPMNPHVLQQQAYRPFIEMIRANMQSCGALRIDHIMCLLRLWWVRCGDSAKNGAYVGYPVDDLIAILALESQRQQCMIIGEDLGTVPKAIVSKLKNAGIFSYKIFYFEFDQQGQSRALAEYPYQAMTTLSTHDLPTVNGYWRGHDFELGQQYQVYPDPKILARLQQDRVNAKQKILQRLQQAQLEIPPGVDASLSSDCPLEFNHALQRYVAAVNSALFGLQPEDWLGMTEPVNIPGTSTQYPNWRRRLNRTLDDIFADPAVLALLQTVSHARKMA
ncbi:4-alpha-glucanotransferase [Pasteurellaceae bacterium USgator11]|nr:4-alpha-glucanotransferase [Pasteurellaceae bacterium UScroc12]TNG97573.1 4-alpha-glucanotransferase [Pasteurellaceae bacterium USgator41]TNG98743.1 4-alpha-glucanotransferase [Pasteurellaceae bacterium UScroc31]TNG99468.1 4-alpha-glucanotransferase [Pasteurellaceae bacterium USgator11]